MKPTRSHFPLVPAIRLAVAAVFLAVSAVGPPDALSQNPARPPGVPAPPAYMGRTIAQTMHYTGAEWLIRENRESEERSSQMLAQLNVKPGMTVCDMGCGNGFHSIKLARFVGASGTVLGVDVQPEMLRLLELRAKQAGVENIKLVLGTVDNPGLPDGKVDLILCVDVYHEFSNPESMLREMREALAPKGQLVLVEFRAEDANVPIQPLHKMSKAQIKKELGANGFRCDREFNGLPWQHMMFFTRE